MEKIRLQLEKETSNKEKYQAELEKIKTAQAVAQAELKTLGGQIVLLNPDEYRQREAADLETEKQRLQQEYAFVEKKYTELTNRLTELRKVKDTISGSLEANRKEIVQELGILAVIQKELDVRLQQSQYQHV